MSWFSVLFIYTLLVFFSFRLNRSLFNGFTVTLFGLLFGTIFGHSLRLLILSDAIVEDLEIDVLLIGYGLSAFFGYVLANYFYRFRPTELSIAESLLMKPPLFFLISLACFWHLNTYAAAPFLFLVNPKITYVSAIDNGLMWVLTVGYITAFIGAAICLIRKKWLGLMIFVVMLLAFGKKTPIFWLVILYGVYNSGLKFNFSQFRGLALGAILLVFSFSVTHVSDATLISKIASYFDYYENTSEILARSEGDTHTFKKSMNESFYGYIPRLLWPEKPMIYGRVNVHAKYYSDDLANGYTKGYLSEVLIPYKAYGSLYLIFSSFTAGFFMTLIFNFAVRKNFHALIWYSCFPNIFFLAFAMVDICMRWLKRGVRLG